MKQLINKIIFIFSFTIFVSAADVDRVLLNIYSGTDFSFHFKVDNYNTYVDSSYVYLDLQLQCTNQCANKYFYCNRFYKKYRDTRSPYDENMLLRAIDIENYIKSLPSLDMSSDGAAIVVEGTYPDGSLYRVYPSFSRYYSDVDTCNNEYYNLRDSKDINIIANYFEDYYNSGIYIDGTLFKENFYKIFNNIGFDACNGSVANDGSCCLSDRFNVNGVCLDYLPPCNIKNMTPPKLLAGNIYDCLDNVITCDYTRNYHLESCRQMGYTDLSFSCLADTNGNVVDAAGRCVIVDNGTIKYSNIQDIYPKINNTYDLSHLNKMPDDNADSTVDLNISDQIDDVIDEKYSDLESELDDINNTPPPPIDNDNVYDESTYNDYQNTNINNDYNDTFNPGTFNNDYNRNNTDTGDSNVDIKNAIGNSENAINNVGQNLHDDLNRQSGIIKDGVGAIVDSNIKAGNHVADAVTNVGNNIGDTVANGSNSIISSIKKGTDVNVAGFNTVSESIQDNTKVDLKIAKLLLEETKVREADAQKVKNIKDVSDDGELDEKIYIDKDSDEAKFDFDNDDNNFTVSEDTVNKVTLLNNAITSITDSIFNNAWSTLYPLSFIEDMVPSSFNPIIVSLPFDGPYSEIEIIGPSFFSDYDFVVVFIRFIVIGYSLYVAFGIIISAIRD